MLAKEHRFHGPGPIGQVYRRGQTVRSPYCAMKFLPGKQGDPYRVAVVVAKKVDKSAPNRNRIRRRVYEVIRTQPDGLTNQDIVINIFDDRFLTMPHDEMVNSIKRQLKEVCDFSANQNSIKS